MRKCIFPIILIFFIIFGTFYSIPASAYQISGFEVNAKAAVLISLDTGEVIYSKNTTDKVYPASLMKLLSAVLIIEHSSDLDSEKITMTQAAMYDIMGTGAAVNNLKVGEQLTARQALACLMISSGGDTALAVAYHYGGSIQGYMDMVNAKAQEIGMKNSHFGNPVGLHDEETYTTVEDLVLLAKYALKYPEITELAKKSRHTVEATEVSSERILCTTNFLVDPNTAYYYAYATGLKTGFTDEAGRCLISTAKYNGYSYLSVVVGCKEVNGVRTEFTETANLFRWAFNNFKYTTVVNCEAPVCEMPVRLSRDTDFVSLYAKEPLNSIFPKDADLSTVKIVEELDYESIDAPVKKGTVLGTASVIYAEQEIGRVELVAGNDVEASGILVFGDKVMKFLKSPFFITIVCIIVGAILAFIIAVIYLNRNRTKKRKVRYIPYDKDKK